MKRNWSVLATSIVVGVWMFLLLWPAESQGIFGLFEHREGEFIAKAKGLTPVDTLANLSQMMEENLKKLQEGRGEPSDIEDECHDLLHAMRRQLREVIGAETAKPHYVRLDTLLNHEMPAIFHQVKKTSASARGVNLELLSKRLQEVKETLTVAKASQ